ncbi:uncharacterized [Lates japonicus]
MYCVKYGVCTVLTDAQHTIRHGHVWTPCVTAGAGGPRVSVLTHCAHDEHELRKNLQRQSSILLSHTVSSKCNNKKFKIYFCQATFMALYLRQKTMLQYRASAPSVVPLKDFLNARHKCLSMCSQLKIHQYSDSKPGVRVLL